MKQIFFVVCFAVFSLGMSIPDNAFAEISLSSFESNIEPKDSILVFGTIEGVKSFKPVNLVVYDPSGNVIYAPNVMISGEEQFRYLIHPTLPSFEVGTYTVEATHEDLEQTIQLQFVVASTSVEIEDAEVIPEFGTITTVILVVAISGIIVMSAKFGSFRINKF